MLHFTDFLYQLVFGLILYIHVILIYAEKSEARTGLHSFLFFIKYIIPIYKKPSMMF